MSSQTGKKVLQPQEMTREELLEFIQDVKSELSVCEDGREFAIWLAEWLGVKLK